MTVWMIVALVAIGLLIYAIGLLIYAVGFSVGTGYGKATALRPIGTALNSAAKGEEVVVALGNPSNVPYINIYVDLLEAGAISKEQFDRIIKKGVVA